MITHSISAKSKTKNISFCAVLLLSVALVIELFAYFESPAIPKPAKQAEKLSAPPVVLQIENTGLFQRNTSVIWEELIEGTIINEAASLVTLEMSLVELTFSDKTKVTITQNSKLNIKKAGLELERGSVRIKTGKIEPSQKLMFKIGEQELALADASDVFAETGLPPMESRIVVYEGEAIIKSALSEISAKKGDEAVLSNSTFLIYPRKLSFSLVEPINGSVEHASKGSKSIKFRWTIDPKQVFGSAIALEVSSDRDFSTSTIRKTVAAAYPPLKEAETTVSIPIQPEKKEKEWFWKVKSVAQRSESETNRLFVLPEATIKQIYPPDGTQIEPGDHLDVVWEKQKSGYRYEILLTEGEKMETVHKIVTSDNFFRFKNLPEGNFLWSILAFGQKNTLRATSDSKRIIVRKKN